MYHASKTARIKGSHRDISVASEDEYAQENRFKFLTGQYIPTTKNTPCKNFYIDHHFYELNDSNWQVNLCQYKTQKLPWINVNNIIGL